MRAIGGVVVAFLATALFTASEVRAQALAAPPGTSVAAQAAPAGPTIAAATAGVRATVPVQAERIGVGSALQQERRMGRNVALMIVGGAAVVTGLLIGDDVGALLAVGGAVVGLYGLYQFVR